MRTTPILLACAAVFLNCATLNPVLADSCGNGVIEAGEDCDSSNPALKCGAPTAGVQACHFVCTTTADCAAGSSCSASGVCRRPTGAFASLTTGYSANVSTLLAGDFDGDKHTDVIGSPPFGSAGASRVHFFDDSSVLASSTLLDLPLDLGVVKDLDTDGLDDLGFAVRNLGFGAFGALKGQRDRSFATVLYPALTFPGNTAKWAVVTNSAKAKLPGTAPACAFGLLDGYIGPNNSGTRINSICNGAVGTAGVFNMAVPSFTPVDVIGDPQAGDVDKLSICGELVMATKTLVYLVPLCAPDGNWEDGPKAAPVPIDPQLASEEEIDSIYVGPIKDFDRDDIVIHTSKGKVLVYDSRTPSFTAPDSGLASATSVPLATGDLNGDDAVDFVFPQGITFSAPAGDAGVGTTTAGDPSVAATPRDGLTWKYARIGRFNDDDLPDVLVSFDGQLDVDVLGNAGNGRFTPFTVRSDKVVRAIGSGDFDGDRIQDIAFLQSATDDETAAADLQIAFGSASGAPEAAHVVGSLTGAHGLLALADGSIGVDDLSVTGSAGASTNPNSKAPPGAQAEVTVLFGTGSRTQVAPLFMLDTTSSQAQQNATGSATVGGGLRPSDQAAHFWQPASFSIGPFVTAGPNQIVSIAVGFDYTPPTANKAAVWGKPTSAAWFAGHDDSAVGGLVPFTEAQPPLTALLPVDPTSLESGHLQLETVTASGEIDYPAPAGGEIDEMITLTKSAVEPTTAVVYVVRPNANATVPTLAARITNASVVGSDPIQIIDVTGDHIPDVAFILTVDNARKLMIMKGDGTGGFAEPVAAAVPTDAVTFAPIDTGKTHLELAVVTPTKLFLASLDGATEITPESGLSFTGVTVGDFNGDGVQDIALAESGTIRLLPQKFAGQL